MQTTKAVAAFLLSKRAKNLSPRTLEGYEYRLGIFASRFKNLPTRPEPLERFLLSTGPTPDTRDTYFRLLRNFYRWLKRRSHIRSAPFDLIEAPQLRQKVAPSLTLDELARLLNWPEHPSQHRAFLYLLSDTMLRLSEALSVNSPDRIRDSTIVVVGKKDDREVPISPSVRAMVLDAIPWPWSNRWTAGNAVRRAFRKAGFMGPRASAHTLRHTFARLWDGDESILDGIAGWASPRMRKRYRPYDIGRAIQQHRKSSPVNGDDFGQLPMF